MRYQAFPKIQLTAAVCALAATVPMQAGQHVTFHLPVEAHWGSAVLEPGDYSVQMPAEALGEPAFRVQGDGKASYALPETTDSQSAVSNSRIELSEIDGVYFVRKFSSRAEGKQYLFAVPRSRYREMAKNTVMALPIDAK